MRTPWRSREAGNQPDGDRLVGNTEEDEVTWAERVECQRSMLLESSARVCPEEANTSRKNSCNGRPR